MQHVIEDVCDGLTNNGWVDDVVRWGDKDGEGIDQPVGEEEKTKNDINDKGEGEREESENESDRQRQRQRYIYLFIADLSMSGIVRSKDGV